MHNPLEQFEIKNLYSMHLGALDVSFTNSAFFMVLVLISVLLFLGLGIRKKALVPGRWQLVSEMTYQMVDGMITGTIGEQGRKFMPIIFSLFMFILFGNLLGMVPYCFTITSHIIVTFALAMFVFLGITILGFIRHGFHYFSLFLPKGTPMWLAPMMIVIELFAYLARPVSLSVRLAANMMAGHIVLKLLASFTIMAGFLGFLPFTLLTILQGFEIFIAILQAYIFTILSCAYLSDAVNLH